MRLFAITYVLEIHMYVFRPHPGEIVKMSQDKFKIFDLSRISAFIKYIVYWGFLAHRPEILVNLYMKVTLKERRSRAPLIWIHRCTHFPFYNLMEPPSPASLVNCHGVTFINTVDKIYTGLINHGPHAEGDNTVIPFVKYT